MVCAVNTTTFNTAALQARLSERGQGHVLNFWNDLDQGSQDNLLREVSNLDLDLVNHLMDVAASPAAESKAPNITPPETITLAEVRANGDRIRAAREAGAAPDAPSCTRK